MSMRENDSYRILRRLGADYVLVIFGGMIGYSSDDINKMLWMIRIGGNTNPVVKEHEYYDSRGQFNIGEGGSETLLNSVMYSLCYYRFDEVPSQMGQPGGFDRVRHQLVGRRNIQLRHFTEAFTSEHWYEMCLCAFLLFFLLFVYLPSSFFRSTQDGAHLCRKSAIQSRFAG